MNQTIIELNGVTYAYPKGGFYLECPELSLNTAEIALFSGANGSGKTTLLKLCCGILKPTDGALIINNEDATSWSLGKIGQHIGYLFQEPSRQLFTATVWDEMTFIGAMKNEPHDQIKQSAVELLKRFNLYDMLKRSTYRLSRGEKQRLAIAAILMQSVKYLILDEPTTGLDSANRSILYDVIDKLVDDGVGVSIISHDNELLNKFNNARKIYVQAGRVIQ